MAFFIPFTCVALCQFYSVTSPVAITIIKKAMEWEKKIFLLEKSFFCSRIYMCVSWTQFSGRWTEFSGRRFKSHWVQSSIYNSSKNPSVVNTVSVFIYIYIFTNVTWFMIFIGLKCWTMILVFYCFIVMSFYFRRFREKLFLWCGKF